MGLEIPESIRSQVFKASEVIQRHLDSTVKAIYLYGSAVDGDLRPSSDIDLFVIVDNAIVDSAREHLMTELLTASSPHASSGFRPLEVTVVELQALKPWIYPPRRELQFGEWLRKDLEKGIFEGPMTDPDLTILLTKIKSSSIVIYGASASDLVDLIPTEDLREALRSTLMQWKSEKELVGDERNIVLAVARIWYTAMTGAITSKDSAVDWLIPRVPKQHAELLSEARSGYLGGATDRLNEKHRELLDFVFFSQEKLQPMLAGG